MDVIVIGGGIAGVATAYQLRAAGHRVCVVERHATVAQGATYGHGGTVLPTPLDVWFGPTFMAHRAEREKRRRSTSPDSTGRRASSSKKLADCRSPTSSAANTALLRPLIELSREAMADMEARFGFEFEQASGLLYLVAFRAGVAAVAARARAAGALRSAASCAERPPNAPAYEHSVRTEPEFAGGVLFEHERTANCPLFTKLLKQTLDTQGGVQFMLGCEVSSIRLDGQRAAVELAPRPGAASRSREVE